MKLTLLYFEGCPHWVDADRLVSEVAAELGNIEVDRRIIDTPEQAEKERFRGSPTILVDGTDPFADMDAPAGLSCRLFQMPDGPAGTPTKAQLVAAITKQRDVES